MSEQPDQLSHVDGVPVVRAAVEVDATNAADLRSAILTALGDGAGRLIVDMSETEFCDSSGIRYLLLAHDEATAHHAQLRLAVQPDGMVLRMLTLMGLHRVLQVHVSLDEATAA